MLHRLAAHLGVATVEEVDALGWDIWGDPQSRDIQIRDQFMWNIQMVLAEPNHHPDSVAVIPEENCVSNIFTLRNHKVEAQKLDNVQYQQ